MRKQNAWLGRFAVSSVLALTTGAVRAQSLYPVVWGQIQTGMPANLTVTAIAPGEFHTLALTGSGTIQAWGSNLYGQTDVPSGLSGVRGIAVGSAHSLALKNDGTVVAWGDSSRGQTSVPAGLNSVIAIAAGDQHNLALRTDGTVVAWGFDSYGQTDVPAGLTGVMALAAGVGHSLALKTDGTVVSWGWNAYGQSSPPPGLSGVVAIAAGAEHSLALKADGTVVGWGFDPFGQTDIPPGLTGVTSIAAGLHHSLALKNDGAVVAWGLNDFGQSTVPASLAAVSSIAAGGRTSYALKPQSSSLTQITIAASYSDGTGQFNPAGGFTFSVFGEGCQPGHYATAITLGWAQGSVCTLTFDSPQNGPPGTRYIFGSWSDGDRAGPSRTIIAPAAPTSYTAQYFRQFLVTTGVGAGGAAAGSITPATGWFNEAPPIAPLIVTATANPGYIFTGFSGDLSGTANPQRIVRFRPYTITANFAPATNIQTTLAVSPVSGQYSDRVTLSATVLPAALAVSGSLQFSVNGVAAGPPLQVNGSGTYSTPFTIALPAGTYPVSAVFSSATPAILGSSGSNDLVVTRENVIVQPSATNPLAIQVNSAGGTVSTLTLSASIQDAPDSSPGNITSDTPVTVTLNPIVADPAIRCPVTTALNNGVITVTARCSEIPVNVYEVSIEVGGNYFAGMAESVLAVYDTSLGALNAGGVIVNLGATATLGIDIRYLKNGQIQGGLLYVEHRAAGDLILKSTALLDLSIVGNTAVLLSKANLNGRGNYTVQAIAVDNGEPGSNDRLGLRVTAPDGSVFSGLTFDPVALTGGNIRISR